LLEARNGRYLLNRALIRVTMGTAALLLAHQVAGKALRDVTFLTSWSSTALPLMTVGTAAFTGVLVPVVSRLMARFSPVRVVGAGFALSAAAHVLEWRCYDLSGWTAVIIYLHLAGVGAVLLSGFWSLIAERFDPAGARAAGVGALGPLVTGHSFGRRVSRGASSAMISSIGCVRMGFFRRRVIERRPLRANHTSRADPLLPFGSHSDLPLTFPSRRRRQDGRCAESRTDV